MYAHNIISWHEDEPITPEQALEFGKEFAEQWFAGFQSLVGVHIDRNHVHCHIVIWKDSRKHITFQNAEGDLNQMEQSYSSQISRLKSEIQNLSDKIVKLNSSDSVLKENEKLKRQNEELQKSEREAREEAEKEVAHVKSEHHQKEQELDQLIEDAEREKQKALGVQSVV